MISVREAPSSFNDACRAGDDTSDRNRDEFRELSGKSEAIELGDPGIELRSRSFGCGEEGGDGREAVERGEHGGE